MQIKGNEFFYFVSELIVPKINVNDKIIDYIELFIDQIPILTEQIKRYLHDARTVAFVMNMKTISVLLYEIYAKGLSAEADKIIKLAEADDLIACEKRITAFVTDLLSLSIDLQIAQKNADTFGDQSIAAEALRIEYTELLEKLDVILGKDNQKKKLLAVDDHPGILISVKGMLESHFTVYAASGGKTALEIMAKHKPDIFLLDIEMPDISGFELAKTIRKLNEHKTTPIIFLTSNATREYVMEALRCGANDFIVKPASYDSVMLKISKLMNRPVTYKVPVE